jgi:pyridoxamine 5'-phosphate oxidase
MRHMHVPDELLPDVLPAEPMRMLAEWLDHATRQRLQPNPNAMVLATTTPDGKPSARVVLCKEIAIDPGYVVFYTNYRSRKGHELTENPRAAAVIHWDALHRQVRLEGAVTLATPQQSDAYFASRPWQSRLGAWASAQSQPVHSRADMVRAVAETAKRLGAPDPATGAEDVTVTIPRPPHWGGYQLWLDSVELLVEGMGRVDSQTG